MRITEVFHAEQPKHLRMLILDFVGGMLLRAEARRHRARILQRKLLGNWRTDHRLFDLRSQLVSDFIKAALAKAGSGGQGGYTDVAFAADFPALWDFMTLSQWEPGKPRKTATVSIFAQDGLFKCFLNDRESRKCVCVASRTILGLWDVLEATLTSDDPGWRQMDRLEDGRHSTTRRKPA